MFIILLALVVTLAILTVLVPRKKTVIAISGASGSGKTTIAQGLARLFGGTFIDLDDYFYPKDQLQRVPLSTGEMVTLYDSYDAIDWERFWDNVKACKSRYLFIAGFCLPIDDRFNHHFHLVIDKEICKIRRVMSKGFVRDRVARDHLEVDEYVWPFYEKNYPTKDVFDEVLDATLAPSVVFTQLKNLITE